ncbi:N-ethylmaleimide reductase [Bacillus iocasae]|uniref:N-ethylmaleimide reductase n=1 Tax=Priestia iocasae TaxID=2291674 RepID=A0ABS2QXL5_9BACI|nr:alkene reductase [Metabacillus iocasae]MBM7703923.1 N-ethylmaleimide reductase [Metabacillus iocasae]
MSNITKLLEPTTIEAFSLKTRTAMAPMTRCFADDETGVVNEAIVEYYRKRAEDGIGLIITEGTVISDRAKGNPGVPGIYSPEQVAAWRKVTEAVHQEGGTIIAQIWHVGRLSHSELIKGQQPQAPSAIAANGQVPRFRKPYETPEEMSKEDIKLVVAQYAKAARNAIDAGFDGVEVHGAHGYLIDQFNSAVSNKRTDEYGGDLAQRLTFMKEVLRAVINEIGADRVVIRFSPHKMDDLSYRWDDAEQALQTYIDAFKEVGVKMIHPSMLNFYEEAKDGKNIYEIVREKWEGPIIGVGDLTPESAERALQAGWVDVAAIGRPLIANPDYIQRIKEEKKLVEYEASEHLPLLV